jgi:hypothetical protein
MTLRLPNRVPRISSSFAGVFGGDIINGIHDESKYDVVILGAGHNGLVWVNGFVSTIRHFKTSRPESVCRLRDCGRLRVLRRGRRRGGPRFHGRSCERRLRKIRGAGRVFS